MSTAPYYQDFGINTQSDEEEVIIKVELTDDKCKEKNFTIKQEPIEDEQEIFIIENDDNKFKEFIVKQEFDEDEFRDQQTIVQQKIDNDNSENIVSKKKAFVNKNKTINQQKVVEDNVTGIEDEISIIKKNVIVNKTKVKVIAERSTQYKGDDDSDESEDEGEEDDLEDEDFMLKEEDEEMDDDGDDENVYVNIRGKQKPNLAINKKVFSDKRKINKQMTNVKEEIKIALNTPEKIAYKVITPSERKSIDTFEGWCMRNVARYDRKPSATYATAPRKPVNNLYRMTANLSMALQALDRGGDIDMVAQMYGITEDRLRSIKSMEDADPALILYRNTFQKSKPQ